MNNTSEKVDNKNDSKVGSDEWNAQMQSWHREMSKNVEAAFEPMFEAKQVEIEAEKVEKRRKYRELLDSCNL